MTLTRLCICVTLMLLTGCAPLPEDEAAQAQQAPVFTLRSGLAVRDKLFPFVTFPIWDRRPGKNGWFFADRGESRAGKAYLVFHGVSLRDETSHPQ